MDNTLLEIPTALLQAANLTPEEARAELAIRLYQHHRLNEKQAAELAGDSKVIESLVWQNRETGRFDLDDFLDWASHDLKTPLNAVIGFTRVVLKGIDGPINETQNADLTTVFNGGKRVLALISQLVEIARLNNSHTAVKREPCDFAELINESADRWRSQNPAIPLTTDIQLPDSLFDVDALQMRQVIQHLLTFAALRVTEGQVSLTARVNDQDLVVTIQSTGVKNADKMEMDTAMLGFITAALIKLHGGIMETPLETDDGLRLSFSLPR